MRKEFVMDIKLMTPSPKDTNFSNETDFPQDNSNHKTKEYVWETPFEFRNKFRAYPAGFDKDNRRIWIVELGKWDMPELVKKGEEAKKMFERYIVEAIARGKADIAERTTLEHPVTGILAVLDMKGFSMTHLLHYPSFSFMVNLGKKYHHELDYIEVGFIINTNRFAATAFGIVKPLMGKLMSRIQIFTSHKDQWIPKLLEHCQPHQLPPIYGGTTDFTPVFL